MKDQEKDPHTGPSTVTDRYSPDQITGNREDIDRNPGDLDWSQDDVTQNRDNDDWNPEGKSNTYGNYYDNQEDVNRNQGDTDWNEDELNRNPEHDDWDQDEPSRNPSGDKDDDKPRPGEKPIRKENEMPVRPTKELDYERDSDKISDNVGDEGGGH